MPRTERLHFAMPEEFPTANKVVRVDPNNGFPVDALITVFTDGGHMLSLKPFKKSPQRSEYLLALVDAKPPITTCLPTEQEIYIKNDIIIADRDFKLDSLLPVMIGQTTFRALEIYSNIETIVVPMDGRPTNQSEDVQEAV